MAPALGCLALALAITQPPPRTAAERPLHLPSHALDHSQMNSVPSTRVEWVFGREQLPAATPPALILATNFINR